MIVIMVLFTLVVGVVIPYYKMTGEAADRKASESNLQQWGIALNMYMVEHDSRLPETGKEVDPENAEAWYNSLPLYLSRKPLNELEPGELPEPGMPSLWMDPAVKSSDKHSYYFFSYAMNRWLQPDPEVRPCRIYEIENPTRVVFMTETASASPSILPGDVRFRHGRNEAHVLFADGHVERVARAVLVDNPTAVDPTSEKMAKVSWVPFFKAPAPAE